MVVQPIAPFAQGATSLLITRSVVRDDVRWVEVLLPKRPNGTRGWVPADVLALSTTPVRISIDISERDTGSMTDIYASVVVERDSQKAIIIGHKGSRLASVGARARAQIEPLVGTKVFLKLHVRVAKEWQRDPKQLGRLGF